MKIEINSTELVHVKDEVTTIVQKLASLGEGETVETTTEEKPKRSRKKRSDAGKSRKLAKQEPETPEEPEKEEEGEDDPPGLGGDDEEETLDGENSGKPESSIPKRSLPTKKKKPAKKKADKTSAVSREDVYAFLSGFVDNHGRKPVQALLKKLGADKLTDLSEDKYAEFLERLEAFDKKNS